METTKTTKRNGAPRKTRVEAKQEIAAALDGGGAPIGYLVWWSLRGARMRREDLRHALVAMGAEDAAPEELGALTMLWRAEQAVRAGRDMIEFEAVGKTRTEAVHAVLQGTRDEAAQSAEYRTVTRLFLDREKSTLRLEDPTSDVARAVLERFEELRDYCLTQEVSQTISALMGHVNAVCLRESGGVYYVDPRHGTLVAAVRDLVNAMGDSTFNVFPVADATSRAQIELEAKRTLSTKLADLNRECAEFASGKDAIQERSVKLRVDRFKKLAAEVDFYSELLGDERAKLVERIAAARAELEASLLLGEEA